MTDKTSANPEQPGKLRPWVPFIIAAAIVLIAAIFIMMVLYLLPTPSFMEGLVESLRSGLAGFERFFMSRFS